MVILSKKKEMVRLKVAAVDVFCGVGGLTHGLIKAGIPVVAGIDIDRTCKYAYEVNNASNFIQGDLTKLDGKDVNKLYPEGCKKILVGCAPCQPFSSHTHKDKKREGNEKWKLLYSFSRLIKEVKPELVSAENVIEITRERVFKDFVDDLKTEGYHVSWDKVYCPDYGIPQARKRLVLFASKFGDIGLIPATHTREEYKTVRDTIGKLKAINAGETAFGDPLHRSYRLSDINLKRIRQSRAGGTWKDWDEDLLSPCHKKESGRSYGGVYSRMVWDDLSPTITTQFYNYGTGRFGHPVQDRALSLREGALLQTFPLDYDFVDPELQFSVKRIGRHIGNAVPVALGLVIGNSILKHLEEVLNERKKWKR